MASVNPETALAAALAAATFLGTAAKYLWQVPFWFDCSAVNQTPFEWLCDWTAADEAELRAAPAKTRRESLMATYRPLTSADVAVIVGRLVEVGKKRRERGHGARLGFSPLRPAVFTAAAAAALLDIPIPPTNI
ncbi:hypothetical protein CLOP_g19883 [Closterium sp. NIES-67]|nr:hypothetical protein CLOP_g19883 [Closterium sp. NIES-67]